MIYFSSFHVKYKIIINTRQEPKSLFKPHSADTFPRRHSRQGTECCCSRLSPIRPSIIIYISAKDCADNAPSCIVRVAFTLPIRYYIQKECRAAGWWSVQRLKMCVWLLLYLLNGQIRNERRKTGRDSKICASRRADGKTALAIYILLWRTRRSCARNLSTMRVQYRHQIAI